MVDDLGAAVVVIEVRWLTILLIHPIILLRNLRLRFVGGLLFFRIRFFGL